ncbi:MAG: queuosine precursor transporter [Fimbriimonadales bacterium]|nr:queuosine precursor transporter [Fimbriimonadales bacterium]
MTKRPLPKVTLTGSVERGYSIWFVIVVALFVVSLLVSNIIASKIISIGGLTVSVALVIFPVSYILGDVLTEVYGYRRARLVIWIGFACNLLVVLIVAVAIALPPAPFWEHQRAYETVLSATPRLLVASLVAYLVGEFTNSYVLAKLKIATQGRWLWTRTISSTFVAQLLDTTIFTTVAFAGMYPMTTLMQISLTEWLAKTAYEALATPITYAVVGFLKAREGIDVYDTDTRFNPFLVWE